MSDAPSSTLDVLAGGAVSRPWESLAELWDAYAEVRAAGASPLVAAVSVAYRTNRLGYAFAVGYPAALERLVPGVELPCALCATEADGNHPRAIATTLRPTSSGYRLDGAKTFVTFGTLAKSLIIVAKAGVRADGRPEIAVVRIPADRPGITLEELSETPFVPEVRHARLDLDAVHVAQEERLPGDGYANHVKPFRTIEDIHVVGATLGYLAGWGRRAGCQPSFTADVAALLAALEMLSAQPPLAPEVHVALEGVYQQLGALLGAEAFETLLEAADADERERWTRDRPLLRVAQNARDARFARAMKELG